MAVLPVGDVAAPVVVDVEGTLSPYTLLVQLFLLTFFSSPARGGRGGGRGGAAGAKGGKKVIVEPHRHKGVFVARGGKEDLLATVNLVPGESVYGEKRISTEGPSKEDGSATTKTEYRVSWLTASSKCSSGRG